MINKGSEEVVQQDSTVTGGRKDTWTNICHAESQKPRRIVKISDKKFSGGLGWFDKEDCAYLYGIY